MKTIWIFDHYASEPKFNGIRRQYDIAHELSLQGNKVIVISSSYSHFNLSYFSKKKFTSYINENFCFYYIPSSPSYIDNGIKRFLNMLDYTFKSAKEIRSLEKIFGKPDHIIGCSVHPFTWLVARYASIKYSTEFIIEVRDFWPEFFIENNLYDRSHIIIRFFSYLEKWAYKNADKIIVSLPYAHRYINGKLGFDKKKIFWIGQPMDYGNFDKLSKVHAEDIPMEIKKFVENSYVCIFAGYFKKYEGVYTMLESAKYFQENNINIKFLFVGSGSEKKNLINFVKEHSLSNVLIHNRINKELIPSLLNVCQIKLSSLYTDNPNSFSYGISKNKLNEYLYSNGVTIFGFNQQDSIISLSGGGIVIDPNNFETLTETIKNVYQMSEDEFNYIDLKGKEYIIENFSNKIIANKYIGVLNEK